MVIFPSTGCDAALIIARGGDSYRITGSAVVASMVDEHYYLERITMHTAGTMNGISVLRVSSEHKCSTTPHFVSIALSTMHLPIGLVVLHPLHKQDCLLYASILIFPPFVVSGSCPLADCKYVPREFCWVPLLTTIGGSQKVPLEVYSSVSLGCSCTSAQALCLSGMRSESHCFDWVRSSPKSILRYLEGNCGGVSEGPTLFERTRLVVHELHTNSYSSSDEKGGEPSALEHLVFDEEYEIIGTREEAQKAARRAYRLPALLKTGCGTLLVLFTGNVSGSVTSMFPLVDGRPLDYEEQCFRTLQKIGFWMLNHSNFDVVTMVCVNVSRFNFCVEIPLGRKYLVMVHVFVGVTTQNRGAESVEVLISERILKKFFVVKEVKKVVELASS